MGEAAADASAAATAAAAAAVGDWRGAGAAQDSPAEAGGLGRARGRHGSMGLSRRKLRWSWFVVVIDRMMMVVIEALPRHNGDDQERCAHERLQKDFASS